MTIEHTIREYVLKALDYVAARGPLKPLGVAIRWAFVFYLELVRDLAFVRASGMAYATLVALVPGLVVVLGVLQATNATDDPNGVLGLVFDRVFGAVPGLSDQLIDLIGGLDMRALGAVSLIGLLVVASRLYLMVERAYSDIFGVPVMRRPLGLRMLSFYFTITAVPVVLAIALRSTFRFASEFGVPRYAGDWVAFALEYLALVAALKLLPATPVRWRPAFLGAFTSFVLIEVGRYGFGFYVNWVMDADTLSAVYGSLAIVPVFLFWIYLLWVFVLLGVEVAKVSQNYASLVEKELELSELNPSWPSAETALRVAAWIGWSFHSGRGPVSDETLADRAGLDSRDLFRVLDVLRAAGIVVQTDEGWLLSRPASAIALTEIVGAWREQTEVGLHKDRLAQDVAAALALEGSLGDGIRRWLPAIGPAPKSGSAIG